MASNSTREFQEFLDGELKKYKGVVIPVRASLVERAVVRRLPCSKLHPNPEDEFTHDDVGPSYRIITEYTQQYREVQRRGTVDFEDPLLVEKIKPDG
ncbi:MAG: transcriptional regulator, partial [Lachnospiraceae bacterium]|nr:transcriptional regulator [Lachnospiraceae bacterium]